MQDATVYGIRHKYPYGNKGDFNSMLRMAVERAEQSKQTHYLYDAVHCYRVTTQEPDQRCYHAVQPDGTTHYVGE